ncbi:sporulation protein [Streptomyces sp. NPDC014734]|uniref:sporulation protein n=1 Tax=Streptomyces sp. NPDC014734 TaxID=3364886 RepID=UPI0036F8CEEB
MVFKRLLGSLGVGGPTVDTVLDAGAAVPGGRLSGRVELRGGAAAFDIEHITLELVARVEAEHDGGEREGVVVFERLAVGGGFRLAENELRGVPFTVVLPWETPVTELYGQDLGIVLGVRTELSVAGARDSGDLDQLVVAPLPVQEAVLDAFGQLGCGFRSADLEYGRIGGTRQQLPFYQEIELLPPPRYADRVDEIEVTFLASPGGMEVVMEADLRGGPHADGHDALSRFTVTHDVMARQDWCALVEDRLRQLIEHRPVFPADRGYETHGYHGHDEAHGYHGHDEAHGHGHGGGAVHGDDGRRSGPGVGTAVAVGAAGLAVGVVGGLVAAEVIDEVGDFFEGDEDEGGED